MSAAVRSMTGYATLRVDATEQVSFTLTLKSVNHRFLDLQVRLPQGFDRLEAAVRKAIKEQVHRGHVEFSWQIERQAQAGFALNEEQIAAYIAAFRVAAEVHGLGCEPDLNDVLRLPGMMSHQAVGVREDAEVLEAAVMAALPGLLERFNATRADEGAVLAAELKASMLRIEALADQVSVLREGARAAAYDRLRTRILELIKDVPLNDGRLMAEAALLAERGDVEEELVRLKAHASGFVSMVEQGGPIGKRLDFLLQELNREANTLLSKTSGAASQNGLRITELGLEAKGEIERAKEQVQNLE